MGKTNLTIQLDVETVLRAKALAVPRGMSVTTLVARPLEAMVDEEERYEAARRQADQLMAEARRMTRPAGRATSSTTVEQATHVRWHPRGHGSHGGMTRRVALLGNPLKRRHSQVMHDAAFDAAGIDARYVLLELEPDAVEAAVAAARGPEWLGLGVTAPYKPVVAGLVDEVEPDALAIGAVNNVVRTDDGRLVGFNSDAPGFRAGVEAAMGRSLEGLDVVVAGAGGAAHAVVYACLTAGARRVTVGNRTLDGAERLAARFEAVRPGAVRPVVLGGDAFAQALASADLAVNATTVGMLAPGATIAVELLPAHATVFDLVYVPPVTPLLRAARARGLRAANGSEMLIRQAELAFERWTGIGGMAEVMRAAVAPLLADPATRA